MGSWLKQRFLSQRLRGLLVPPDLDPQCLPGRAQARRLLPVTSWAAGTTASKMLSFTSNKSPYIVSHEDRVRTVKTKLTTTSKKQTPLETPSS